MTTHTGDPASASRATVSTRATSSSTSVITSSAYPPAARSARCAVATVARTIARFSRAPESGLASIARAASRQRPRSGDVGIVLQLAATSPRDSAGYRPRCSIAT
ncbi:hypothetical protein GCM10025865_04720 [Paraoerskovia sediminicola]|uniref:Uncharacterized protein n=1 Tax=Paraoerskovia sediminicola TaxID=1138587 RepID=A0ABN6X8N0_9CELL|nr:hypothetical protein GCM10025865_04720 [Paraoerskovia sediminicola]